MNITLKQAIRIGGVVKPAGTTLTVDNAIGADLVARQVAIDNMPFYDEVPVKAKTNPLTGGIEFSLAGKGIYSVGALSQPLPSDLPWMSLRSRYDWAAVSIPSPYNPTHTLHPSVVYFDAGWRGFKYWMAYTPYPNADSNYENPCLCASNDAVNWVAVGAQPLIEKPSVAGQFNSDTELVYDASNDRLVMVFRAADGAANAQRLKVMVSSDGVVWSAPVVIYTSANNGTSTSTDIASPSLMYNSMTSKWEIYGHVLRDTGSAWPLGKITSPDLFSGWDTTPIELTVPPLSGRKLWHSEIRRLSSGSYIGLVQDNANVTGGAGNLFAIYSADGTNFSIRKIDDGSNRGYTWYRPSFIVRYDLPSAQYVVEVFGSRLNTSGMFYQVMRFDAEKASNPALEVGALLSAASSGFTNGILLVDSFNRADSATGLGTSTDGKTYTQLNGTDLVGILSNAAYNVTTGNCRAVVAIGVPDYVARATFKTKTGNGMWLMLRYIDSNNFIRVGISVPEDQIRLQRVTGGSVQVDIATGVTPAAGDEIMVRCAGNELTIYHNGLPIKRIIDQQGVTTGLTVGLQMAGTTGAIDNFVVTQI